MAAIAAGGALGALARWGVVKALPEPTGWPWAIFLVNVAGSLVLGWLGTGMLRRHSIPLHLAVATGFCGALTTFSGFAVDTATLWSDNRIPLALAYGLGSVAAGLLAVMLGHRLAGPGTTPPGQPTETAAS